MRLKFVWNIPEPGTGFGFFQLDNIRLNTAPNLPPAVDITSPADGSSFTSGQPVTFVATAVDTEDGDISASLSWSSDRDGAIGSGASVSTSSLSVGAHAITASVTDSGGLLRIRLDRRQRLVGVERRQSRGTGFLHDPRHHRRRYIVPEHMG